MKVSSVESPINTPLKILLMGTPGSRKTTLALQFPDPHILDCDRNLMGAEEWVRKHINKNLSYTYDDIRVDDKGEHIEVTELYNRVCDKLDQFKHDAAYKARKTVVVDSLSHVNEFIIRHTLYQQFKTKQVHVMEARDWAPFKSYAYIFLVGKLEAAHKTVVCTAHEVKVYEAGNKDNIMNPVVKEYEPFFQGKVGETIGAFFTDIWRLEVESAPAGTTRTILMGQRTNQCTFIKNSVGLPARLDITDGFKVLEPFLRGKL